MIKYILFDLDETLYPATSGLMPAIGTRMRLYLEQKFKLKPEDAQAMQRRYFDAYGTTLRGLVMEQQIDPLDFLGFVHDVDVSQFILPDERLRDVLASIPYRKVIVTNADLPHAERVLARLGVADQFRQIFDIVFMEYECKPARGAYERVLETLGVRGDECILVEDTARNLPTARELGIATILVMKPHALNPLNGRFTDPAAQPLPLDCSPDANVCIEEIYRVADTIRNLDGDGLTWYSTP